MYVQYPISSPAWTEFLPDGCGGNSYCTHYYSEARALTVPPLALPAILSFLTLVNRFLSFMPSIDLMSPSGSSGTLIFGGQGIEWDNEWQRCLSLGRTSFHKFPSGAFTPGSIQGVWEGVFTVRSRINCLDII
jgi:hypothetical protein